MDHESLSVDGETHGGAGFQMESRPAAGGVKNLTVAPAVNCADARAVVLSD
jgi:hypothetical protein